MAQDASPADGFAGHEPTLADERDEILAGLRAAPKQLSPKYFYDRRGSELFDAICELPEYYPTRTELGILRDHGSEIAGAAGSGTCLIEFGSGSSVKIRRLLSLLPEVAAYVPVEISRSHLLEAAAGLARDFPGIEIRPVCADFTGHFELPALSRPVSRRVVFFPGSTIGNFEPDAAASLLERMRKLLGPRGGALIGVDLQKSREILEPAYNDAQGVTAEFNLNLLRRLNNELDADFDLAAFRHEARYNADAGRIEMYLFSRSEQTVRVDGERIRFARGEALLTEYSHKYTLEGFATLAAGAGLEVAAVWTDPQQLFSVQYLRAR